MSDDKVSDGTDAGMSYPIGGLPPEGRSGPRRVVEFGAGWERVTRQEDESESDLFDPDTHPVTVMPERKDLC